MKRMNIVVSFLLILGLIMAAPALAREGMDKSAARMGDQAGAGSFEGFKASDLIGKDLKATTGEDLGEIKDVVISHDGRVNFVVLSSDDQKDRLIPVPFRSIAGASQRADRDFLTANFDKSKLQNAPSFDEKNWPNLTSSDWENRVYGYYGVEEGHMGVKGDKSHDMK